MLFRSVKTAQSMVKPQHRRPNISKGEREVLVKLRELDVGYNIADKNYGAVVYSKDLFKEQCRLHLEDGKGTYYKHVGRSNEDILSDVLIRLQRLLEPFKQLGEGWKAVVFSILRDAKREAEGGKLCRFYIIWKLHKAANAAGGAK